MHSIDLSPIYGMLNEALLTLLGGLTLWLTATAKAWLQAHMKFLDEQTQAQLAAGLNRALSNGVQIAMQQTDKLEAQYPGLPVQGQIAAWAAQYAVDHSPAAIEKFGLDPNDLALKALAYLPTPAITDDTTGRVIPAPARVEVSNLQPPT
jgi:hypothetical protein